MLRPDPHLVRVLMTDSDTDQRGPRDTPPDHTAPMLHSSASVVHAAAHLWAVLPTPPRGLGRRVRRDGADGHRRRRGPAQRDRLPVARPRPVRPASTRITDQLPQASAAASNPPFGGRPPPGVGAFEVPTFAPTSCTCGRRSLCWWRARSARVIPRRLGRSPSTVLRELRRNAQPRGGKLDYRASIRPSATPSGRLVAPGRPSWPGNDGLRCYAEERLSGMVVNG